MSGQEAPLHDTLLEGQPRLHLAVATGAEKVVAELLAQDPSLLDEKDSSERTALECALDHEHVAIVSLVIAHGPRKTEANERALRWAARNGHGDLVAQIIAKWPAFLKDRGVADEAVGHNQVEIVAQLLTLDSTLLARPALWLLAARNGHDKMLNVAFSYGPVALIDRYGRTALTEAAGGGQESTVALLLSKNLDIVHVADVNGNTALHYAAQRGNLNIVRQLLEHQPKLIDIVDFSMATALHFAVESGSIEVIDYLLDQKPELSACTNMCGQNALHLAAQLGYGGAFLKLLARNPSLIDAAESQNVLYFATEGGDPQVLEAVLSLRPGFACVRDFKQDTALHSLCQHGPSREKLEPYLERIWKLNPSALQAKNSSSQTPFMCSSDVTDPNWGAEFFTRKLSWDEMVRDYKELNASNQSAFSFLKTKLRSARTFAEGQCELALSALLIPGIIDIVKEYFFDEPRSLSAEQKKLEEMLRRVWEAQE